MSTFKLFLDALPTVAKSPYALVAYTLLAAVWALRVWQVGRPQREASKILAQFKDDAGRTKALTQLLGNAPPDGLPHNEVLEWVRIESSGRDRAFVLAAYVATLAAAIVIAVVALVRPPGSGAHRGATATVRLVELSDDSCADLPHGAKLAAAIDGRTMTATIVNGCEALISWRGAADGPRQVTFQLQGGGAYQLNEPERSYWLQPNVPVDVRLARGQQKEPRRKILLLPYASQQADGAKQREFLAAILRSKIDTLAERIMQREPATALSRLKLETADQLAAMSTEDRRKRWVSDHLLEISSGILFSKDGRTTARGELYLGELADPPSIQLDLALDPEAFGKLNDSHALALVFALAVDAEQAGAPKHVITAYLDEATQLCQQLGATGDDGLRRLKGSVATLLQRWNGAAGQLCK
jgi:hypothetical protein